MAGASPLLASDGGGLVVSSPNNGAPAAAAAAASSGWAAAAGSFQVSSQAGVVAGRRASPSSSARRQEGGEKTEGGRKVHRHGQLRLHRDSDGGLRRTRHTGDIITTTTTTLLGRLAFAAPPPYNTATGATTSAAAAAAAAAAADPRQPRIRRPRQRGGCLHHASFSSLSLLSPPPPQPQPMRQGSRASIVPGIGGLAARLGGAGGQERGGGRFSPSSSSSCSPSPLGVGRLEERSSHGGRGSSTSTSSSSTISSEVSSSSSSSSSANNSGGQGQGHGGSSSNDSTGGGRLAGSGLEGGSGSQAAAAANARVWTSRSRFAGRHGAAGGGVRSGGAMAHELRPLLDMLDCARGHRATGAAAMKVLDAAEKAGWEKIRFSALRTGKIAAGAAVAGRWKTHGRPLVESMESLGVPADDICSWTALLLSLSRLGCADECLEVVDMMEEAVGLDTKAGRHSFGSLDSEGRRQENPHSDHSHKDELLTVAHNHCMFAFIKAGRYEEAVKHFDAYFRRPQPSQEAVWARRYNSGGDASRSGPAPLSTATAAGEGAGSPRNVDDGVGGWCRDESVLSPDIFSYTHLMSSLERLGRDRACLSALLEMRARGIKADTYTYVSAMKAVGAAGQWKVAVSLLGELRELEGVAPDVYVYTAAISACSTAGRWEEALSLEGEMRRRGIKPNAYTVTSCISALARGGEWERAAQELVAAEEAGLPVSTPAYNAVLKAFAIGKALQPGLDFFTSMQQEGRVPLDEQTHNIAIELCKECGDTSRAVDILRTMEAAGFPPSVVSYNTALGACEVAGDHRLCLQLLREMKNQGAEGREDSRDTHSTSMGGRRSRGALSPNLWTYNTALGACARAGEWGAVENLLEEMDADLGGDGDRSGGRGGVSEGRGARGGDVEVHEMLHETGGGGGGGGAEGASRSASRNFITFATLIMAADAGGEPRRCLEYYAEMGRFGYNTIL
eukprot:g2055.t1